MNSPCPGSAASPPRETLHRLLDPHHRRRCLSPLARTPHAAFWDSAAAPGNCCGEAEGGGASRGAHEESRDGEGGSSPWGGTPPGSRELGRVFSI